VATLPELVRPLSARLDRMRVFVRSVLAGLGIIASLAACATPARTARAPAVAVPVGTTETGQASWYGQPHYGRATASGEIFDMYALTAAHRTLPFGTRLLVTNLQNDRTVEVRVNDRGPWVSGRILDVSYAAARALDAVAAGVFPVRLRVLPSAADLRR
jgi:peptidoglycan lytic transglycosylase